MRRISSRAFFILALSLAGCRGADAPAAGGGRGNSGGAFVSGQYRNLFAENGRSPEEVKKKIHTAFDQLFHGNPSEQTVYYPAGANTNGAMAYIYDVNSTDVRSEGMSYGMMIAVQLDRKTEFDALWNWAQTWMRHRSPEHPAFEYFSWSMKTNGVANDEMPAPDGEEYFATALYFASGRWGNGAGIYNYHAEADRIVAALRNRERITGRTRSGIQTAGPIFHPEHRLVRFTPDAVHSEHTDPSYHLPAFYDLWARWGPKADRAFWAEAASASRNFFSRATHPLTGLAPEYANFDGSPWAAPWSPMSVNFRFDSWRTAMNWSVDWAWWMRDLREPDLSDRIQEFFETQGLATYRNQFTLDGRPAGGEHSTGLIAMNAVASLAATHARAGQFVDAFWNAPVPSGRQRYYDGMLYLLALLHCSGEFRIWPPRP